MKKPPLLHFSKWPCTMNPPDLQLFPDSSSHGQRPPCSVQRCRRACPCVWRQWQPSSVLPAQLQRGGAGKPGGCSLSSSPRSNMSSPGPCLWASLSSLASFYISGECPRGNKRPGADHEWQRLPRKWAAVFIPDYTGQWWEGFWCHPKWSAGDIIHPEQKSERAVPFTSPGKACLSVLGAGLPVGFKSNTMRLWMAQPDGKFPGTGEIQSRKKFCSLESDSELIALQSLPTKSWEPASALIKSVNMIMRSALSAVSLDRCFSQHNSSNFSLKWSCKFSPSILEVI